VCDGIGVCHVGVGRNSLREYFVNLFDERRAVLTAAQRKMFLPLQIIVDVISFCDESTIGARSKRVVNGSACRVSCEYCASRFPDGRRAETQTQ
jgi:hypothetical protein